MIMNSDTWYEDPDGDLPLSDRGITSRYLPAAGPDEHDALYASNGALVFVYMKDGILRVSVDLDEAQMPDGSDTVPMRIDVQGNTVFEGR
jgi:hypothetical protein